MFVYNLLLFRSIGLESCDSIDKQRKLFGSFKCLDLGRGITFAILRTVGKILLTIDML